ncbi:uncharacterized protein [Nicotiana tomentosiformis]|uniref:uncharacterized protein n=1 Tax=Nicotiana tomentosiformis TaxID=4098 RepID=UPI00388C5959
MATFEALYGRRSRSPIRWFEPGEAKLYGTDLVKDALEKVKLIQERVRTAQSRQKCYVDQKARDLSFMVGKKVLLKVSSMKGIMRFGEKEKPVAIVDKQVRQLRSKKVSAVKVQWRGQPAKEATCEAEDDMQSKYPYLFSTSAF